MDVTDAVSRAPVLAASAQRRRPGSEISRHTQHSQPTQEKEKLGRRLRTFDNWTGTVKSLQLAIAGFMLIGPGDKVECDTCKVKLYNWTETDVPLDVHRKYSPDCSFLKKWFPALTPTLRSGYDVTKAKYSDFVEQVKRLGTFEAWPLKLDIQSPPNMAAAGFFLYRLCRPSSVLLLRADIKGLGY
ncbi:baculoviral IAP repeat-containing protein 7-B-like [Haliotis rubra]|uniref:baculoviral IAP repeat-containing protein 7-B-like n=1 Tax=Haliotis rubra TaxID=36100 RepID=UPI001EE51606|nr:baculoviral IAP repeat-containing protein 7-B-like [Haliotis rubra]